MIKRQICANPTPHRNILILSLGLLLRRADMCVMDLCRELQACDRFLQMRLQGADHDEHEGFRIAAEGVLEEIG